jgi:hypothetical protein
MNFEIKFDASNNNKGTIITPFTYVVYGYAKPFQLEVNFNELYEGTYSFAKYNVCQFIIEADNINKAIELAVERLKDIYKNGMPQKKQVFRVTGIKYNGSNDKVAYTPSFMENTHLRNQFTASSYKTKQGDLLVHDTDGDGYGFWYAVDNDGKIISSRLKGSILNGLVCDGVITQ